MGTFSRSLDLVKESWNVLRSNPQLAIFPVVSSVVMLLITVSFMLPVGLMSMSSEGDGLYSTVNYILTGIFYFISYFVVIFFNAALVFCAHDTLQGHKPTFMDGIRHATKHIMPILYWTLIAATVGLILRFISERTGFIGQIIVSILGLAWNLLTYFVVPVMVLENDGPIQALKDSSSMIRKTWGENIVGNFSISAIFMLLAIVGVVPVMLGFLALSNGFIIGMVLGAAVAVLYWVALGIVSGSLEGIYQTTLYIYGKTGSIPNMISPHYVQGAFVPKAGNKSGWF